MLSEALFFILGLVALVAGAEALVHGASRIALSLGLSSLVVGLTIVAFGTSAPELAVSVGAALDGINDIAVSSGSDHGTGAPPSARISAAPASCWATPQRSRDFS